MADAEIAVVLRLIASQFQSELKKSGGAVGEFGKFISDWRVQATAVAGTLVAITKSTAEYGEELSKTSQKTGVATSQLQGYLYAARLADVSTEQFTQALSHLNKAIAEDAQSLRSVGITGKDLSSVMLQLNDLFQKLPDGPRKTALSMELMGKAGTVTIPVFNQNLRETMKEFDRLGITMSKETIAASQRFNDEMKRLEIRLTGLKNLLGAEILPYANDFLSWLDRVAEKTKKIDFSGFFGAAAAIGALGIGAAQASGRRPGDEKLPPGWLATGAPPKGPEVIVPSSGKEVFGPGDEKGIAEFYKHQREQNALFIAGATAMEEERQAKLREGNALFIAGATAMYEEEKARIEEQMELERKAFTDREAYLKQGIDDYRQWVAAADAANAKFNAEQAKELRQLQEDHVLVMKGLERQRQEGMGFYDGLREAMGRYVRDNEQTFNLATDTVRQAAANMSQSMKTFFLDVLKGQIRDARDLFAGLLSFTQNVLADVAARMASAGLTRGLAAYFGSEAGARPVGPGGVELQGPLQSSGRFQHGGAFVIPGVGGPDSRFIGFHGSPGEKVTIETPEQQRARRGGSVIINVINQTSAQVQPQSRTGPGGESIVDIVIRQVDQALAGGSFDRSLKSNFGIVRQGFAR